MSHRRSSIHVATCAFVRPNGLLIVFAARDVFDSGWLLCANGGTTKNYTIANHRWIVLPPSGSAYLNSSYTSLNSYQHHKRHLMRVNDSSTVLEVIVMLIVSPLDVLPGCCYLKPNLIFGCDPHCFSMPVCHMNVSTYSALPRLLVVIINPPEDIKKDCVKVCVPNVLYIETRSLRHFSISITPHYRLPMKTPPTCRKKYIIQD